MYPKKPEVWSKPFYYEEEVFSKFPNHNALVYYEKESNIGMHSHNYYELIVVLSGTGCHYIGDMAIPISAGDAFVIPPGVAHGYFCYSGESLSVCYFLFRSSFMKRYYGDILSVRGATTFFELEPYLRGVYENNLFLHLDKTSLAEIKRQIEKIVSQNGEEYSAYYEFSVLYTVGTLCRLIQKQSEDSKKRSEADSEILNVLDYLGEHFDEKISIDALCRYANMSRATLHRRFKAVTKLSPMEYTVRLKLKEAKNLIENSSLSKTAIAQACGFYDVSHMQRCLKDYTDLL